MRSESGETYDLCRPESQCNLTASKDRQGERRKRDIRGTVSDREMALDKSEEQMSVLEAAEEGKREMGDMVTERWK